ncbi:WXG100 family type VII secretion target [Actinomyces vulturis]|uniref:WXG100 family type VII secretion target n=1 Tax=Actinomyces vulturis TaxID=1857645 RepID=UPI00082C9095|nr:WXG100 family type VII secretion target [Actinomyces vulturis]
MPVFSVDTALITDAASRTRTRISTIQAEADAMAADLTDLQTSWSGQASIAMGDCATQWHAAQINVQDVLDSISTALDQAAISYDDAESQNSSLFQTS